MANCCSLWPNILLLIHLFVVDSPNSTFQRIPLEKRGFPEKEKPWNCNWLTDPHVYYLVPCSSTSRIWQHTTVIMYPCVLVFSLQKTWSQFSSTHSSVTRWPGFLFLVCLISLTDSQAYQVGLARSTAFLNGGYFGRIFVTPILMALYLGPKMTLPWCFNGFVFILGSYPLYFLLKVRQPPLELRVPWRCKGGKIWIICATGLWKEKL